MSTLCFVARPYPQDKVESGTVSADALVSIVGVSDREACVDESLFGGRILRLSFDDVPVDEWKDPRNGRVWYGPHEHHLKQVLDFVEDVQTVLGRQEVSIAVHCQHGKSRSAAVALALLAANRPPGEEDKAVQALLAGDVDGQICCNPGIVSMADVVLERHGAIEAALASACPRFVTWRTWWRNKGVFDGKVSHNGGSP